MDGEQHRPDDPVLHVIGVVPVVGVGQFRIWRVGERVYGLFDRFVSRRLLPFVIVPVLSFQ